MWAFAVGVLLGVAAIIAFEALLVRRVRFLRAADADGRGSHLEPQPRVRAAYPAPVARFIRVTQDGRRESCEWLNELLSKVFFDYVGKETVQEAAVRGLNTLVSEAKQQRNSKAVGNLKVTEFSVGQTLPVIKDASLSRMASEDDDIRVLLDVCYDAGSAPPKIAIETEIAFGLNVALSVAVVEIAGQLEFVIRKDGEIQLAFSAEPDVTFDIKFRAGGFVSPKVANFISRKLKTVLRQKLVKPQHLTFSLHGERMPRDAPKLRVRVVNGEGLAAKDANGFSDPYFVLHVGDARYRSRFITKTLDPVWNEEHVFAVPAGVEALVIDVFDHDFVGEDDFLGTVSVPLDSIGTGGIERRTLTLQPRDAGDEVQGTVTVELLLVVRSEDGEEAQDAARSDAASGTTLRTDGDSPGPAPRTPQPLPKGRAGEDVPEKPMGMTSSPSLTSMSSLQQHGASGHTRAPSFGQGILRKFRGANYSAEDALRFLANVRMQLSMEMERLVEANERYLTRASYDDAAQHGPLAGTRLRIEELRKEESDLVDYLCTLGWQRPEIDNACEASMTEVSSVAELPTGDDASLDVPQEGMSVRERKARQRPFTGNAHSFRAFNYSKPTNCEHCGKFLWGLKNQGMRCTVCSFDCHRKCSKQVPATCTAGAIGSHHSLHAPMNPFVGQGDSQTSLTSVGTDGDADRVD